MESMKELTMFLESYGGWALSALFAGVIVFLYYDFKKVVNKKDDIIAKLNETHHQEIVDVVRECTGVMTAVSDSLERCERRQDSLKAN